jgi:hypothetical protein
MCTLITKTLHGVTKAQSGVSLPSITAFTTQPPSRDFSEPFDWLSG